jgi:hypothetical protein
LFIIYIGNVIMKYLAILTTFLAVAFAETHFGIKRRWLIPSAVTGAGYRYDNMSLSGVMPELETIRPIYALPNLASPLGMTVPLYDNSSSLDVVDRITAVLKPKIKSLFTRVGGSNATFDFSTSSAIRGRRQNWLVDYAIQQPLFATKMPNGTFHFHVPKAAFLAFGSK